MQQFLVRLGCAGRADIPADLYGSRHALLPVDLTEIQHFEILVSLFANFPPARQAPTLSTLFDSLWAHAMTSSQRLNEFVGVARSATLAAQPSRIRIRFPESPLTEAAVDLIFASERAGDDNAEVVLRRATDAVAANRLQLARSHLERAREKHKDHPAIQVLAGRVALAFGDLAAARQAAAAALAAKPGLKEAETVLGQALSREVRGLEAAAVPGSGELATALGQSFAALGDDRSAEAAYQRAVELDPQQVPAWTGLADIHVNRYSHGLALATIQRARAGGVDDPRVLRKQFDLLREMGLDRDAAEVLADCLGRHRADVYWQSRQLTFLIDHGRYDDAAACIAGLDRVSAQGRLTAAMFEGRLAEAQFRFAEAIEAFERALQVDERHGPAHSGLGRIHLALLDPLASRRHLARSKQLARAAKPDGRSSINPSQSLEGQLMMECWSNTQAAQAGRDALGSGSVSAMRAALTAEPDYTPNAIAAMAQLRRLGLMRTKPPSSAAGPAIPRTVMQFWHDPSPPADVADLVATWRGACADGSHTLHDDRSAREFLRSLGDARLERAFRACRTATKKADLLRLAHLLEHGGVYADADDRCVGDFFAVTEGRSLVLAQEARGSIGNNFCAAAPGHPLIARILEAAVTAILRGDSDSVWLATGPGLWTREVARYLAEADGQLAELGTGILVLERFEQRAFCAMACKVTYKADGHWMRSEFTPGSRR